MKNQFSIYSLICLLAIFALAVYQMRMTDRINTIECTPEILAITDPYTLEIPIFADFDTAEHYAAALRHYEMGGTWATLDNGYVCNFNL